MTYSSVSYGSTGSDVTELQKKLNENGYALEVDGVFGAATQKAVKDYQKKKGLTVDGIAGSETWGSLLKASSSPTGTTTGKQVLSGVSDETYDRLAALEQGYSPSDEVLSALAEQQSVAALRPGEYSSSFAQEIEALYDQLASRQGFVYDPNQDAAYRRYAQLYQRGGQAAMEDTLGQAAALTGGYGSTYAQTAAQQAYNDYMQQLMALIPELEANARDSYDAQGQAMQELYQAALDRQSQEEQAWETAYKAWQDSADRAAEQYDTLYQQDYNAYKTMLSYLADKAAAEQKASDGAKANSGATAAAAEKKASLSSTAGESLERAMGNYLKAGDTDAALALAGQYAARMTPAQKKRFTALFEKYGVTVTL